MPSPAATCWHRDVLAADGDRGPAVTRTGGWRAAPGARSGSGSPRQQIRRDTVSAGLGGTGLAADDLYLMAHHEVSGKLLLQPRVPVMPLSRAARSQASRAGRRQRRRTR